MSDSEGIKQELIPDPDSTNPNRYYELIKVHPFSNRFYEIFKQKGISKMRDRLLRFFTI